MNLRLGDAVLAGDAHQLRLDPQSGRAALHGPCFLLLAALRAPERELARAAGGVDAEPVGLLAGAAREAFDRGQTLAAVDLSLEDPFQAGLEAVRRPGGGGLAAAGPTPAAPAAAGLAAVAVAAGLAAVAVTAVALAAAGDRGEQVDLVAVSERAVAVALEWAALAVDHQRVAQVGRSLYRLGEGHAGAVGGRQELGQRGAAGESEGAVDVVPAGADAAPDEDAHADLRAGTGANQTAEKAHRGVAAREGRPDQTSCAFSRSAMPSCAARSRLSRPVSGSQPIAS